MSEEIEGVDKLLFHDFVRAAACRVNQMLNVHDIAKDVGVTDATAKSRLSVLEKSGVIFYLRPYSNNLLQRTVKTPKLYFFDTGLVAFLTRYSAPDILAHGAINGAILESGGHLHPLEIKRSGNHDIKSSFRLSEICRFSSPTLTHQ